MRNRRIFWAAAMQDLREGAARAGVREERLRATAGLRGVFDLTSWRGRSGRRYVVDVQRLTDSEAAEVVDGVILAVARDEAQVARLVDAVAADPRFRAADRKAWAARMRAKGAAEMHVHRLAASERERDAIVADLTEEPAAGLTAPRRDAPEPGR
jgi:hypothetical protein